MRKSISELIDEFEAARNVGRDPRVGPSDYGGCPRAIMYRVRGVEPGETVQKTRAATMGTLFWQGLGGFIEEQYGAHVIVEGAVHVPGLERGGSYDLRWIEDGELVDVKTVSERAFDRVVTFGAKPENVGQLETYALAVNRERVKRPRKGSLEALGEQAGHRPVAQPVTRLTLAYVNRDNGDVEEVSWDYDEATARAKLSELVHIEQMIDSGMELPRAENARLGAFPCDWCPFWRVCWDVPEGDAPDDYAAKFTRTDPQIEEACETYLRAGQVESAAKAEKAAARDRLVGIEYAAGGFKLSWSGGRTTYVDEIDYDELVVQAQAAGLPVPMMTVEKRTGRRINLRRAQST
jgi:hypothetical protein